jgi:broad specificity phosphatase PhoE
METSHPRAVMIIRHGEKTNLPNDIHLSAKGQQRAEVLEKLFIKSTDRPNPYPKPDFIFAAHNTKESHRPNETVATLAKSLKLTIDDKFESKEKLQLKPGELGTSDLRELLFSAPKYSGKVVLISWRHGSIDDLARELKATNIPKKWKDETFDRVWVLTYDKSGNATLDDRPQRLLDGDSVN